MRRRCFGALLLLCSLSGLTLPGTAAAAENRIAAASSLQFALNDLITLFDPHGQRLSKPVYGASGNLYRQIRQGAPFQIFLSADPALVNNLADAGLAGAPPVAFGQGRLALFASNQSSVAIDSAGEGIKKALADDQVFRFAIANPRHAPYGRAAQQALQNLQLESSLQSRLVFGEKVSQAAMMVSSGAAQLGIISMSLALSPVLAEVGRHVVLSDQLHEPIVLQALAIGQPDDTAAEFLDFLVSEPARDVLRRYALH